MEKKTDLKKRLELISKYSNNSIVRNLSTEERISSIYFSIFTIITNLLSLSFSIFISTPIKKIIKRKRDFEISKFSLPICVWEQIITL